MTHGYHVSMITEVSSHQIPRRNLILVYAKLYFITCFNLGKRMAQVEKITKAIFKIRILIIA